ncbi:MAG: hypothetical protein UHS41_00445 [Lachnospiraceae bacterium]|nr:hypothetical protein [Lachnospiraceae bacterium]
MKKMHDEFEDDQFIDDDILKEEEVFLVPDRGDENEKNSVKEELSEGLKKLIFEFHSLKNKREVEEFQQDPEKVKDTKQSETLMIEQEVTETPGTVTLEPESDEESEKTIVEPVIIQKPVHKNSSSGRGKKVFLIVLGFILLMLIAMGIVWGYQSLQDTLKFNKEQEITTEEETTQITTEIKKEQITEATTVTTVATEQVTTPVEENQDDYNDDSDYYDNQREDDSNENTNEPATEATTTETPATEAQTTEVPATEETVTEAPATEESTEVESGSVNEG